MRCLAFPNQCARRTPSLFQISRIHWITLVMVKPNLSSHFSSSSGGSKRHCHHLTYCLGRCQKLEMCVLQHHPEPMYQEKNPAYIDRQTCCYHLSSRAKPLSWGLQQFTPTGDRMTNPLLCQTHIGTITLFCQAATIFQKKGSTVQLHGNK